MRDVLIKTDRKCGVNIERNPCFLLLEALGFRAPIERGDCSFCSSWSNRTELSPNGRIPSRRFEGSV